MKYLLFTLILLASCSTTVERAEDRVFTYRHEGLCFVIYDHYDTGVAIVQVNCDDLKPEPEKAKWE